MAIHQYENIDVDVDAHIEYRDVDNVLIGPFHNVVRANNCFMTLLRLDISSGRVVIKDTRTDKDINTIFPGFNGFQDFGLLLRVEEFWIEAQLTLEITERLTKDQLDHFLLGIYILTNKGEL